MAQKFTLVLLKELCIGAFRNLLFHFACLHYSSVDPSDALSMPGVKSFVGANDVPGHNSTGPVIFDEEVFASDKVIFFVILMCQPLQGKKLFVFTTKKDSVGTLLTICDIQQHHCYCCKLLFT